MGDFLKGLIVFFYGFIGVGFAFSGDFCLAFLRVSALGIIIFSRLLEGKSKFFSLQPSVIEGPNEVLFFFGVFLLGLGDVISRVFDVFFWGGECDF